MLPPFLKFMTMFYNQIPTGKFQVSATGLRVFKHSFGIELDANKNEFELEESSVVEDRYIVGVWCVFPTANGIISRTSSGKQIAGDAVMNSAYITFQEGQTLVGKRIWLRHIIACNLEGKPYPLNMGKIQMAESALFIGNPGAIQAGDQIQFTFDFLKEKR